MPYENDRNIEKRRFKRIDQHFSAKFEAPSVTPGKWHVIFLRDLSAGGLLFNHSIKLDIGDSINLSVTFPASEIPIACSATVVRVRAWEGPLKVHQIGVSFTDLDDTQRDLITRAAEIYYRKLNENR